MINPKEIKYEKCQPLLLRRPVPASHVHPCFNFSGDLQICIRVPLKDG